MIHGVYYATMDDKIFKLSDIWCVSVADLVSTAQGSPTRTIPYGGIERHWLGGEVSSNGLSL